MNILVTGGSGFIGTRLCDYLSSQGHHITILSRYPQRVNKAYKAVKSLDVLDKNDKVDVVINLAGAPIDKRWTNSYKQKIIQSRVSVTREVYRLVERLVVKPKKVISASAIGYYGYPEDPVLLTEESSCRDSFSHQVCKQWEEESLKIRSLDVPVSILRIGVVLGKGGGIIKKMLPAFKCGLGGVIGSGEQYMSWIHINDLVSIFDLLIESDQDGVFNATAPNSVTNKSFVRLLSQSVNRPAFMDLPSFLVKILFGDMGEELLLKGQNVSPARLEKQGFSFQFPTLEMALKDIVKT